MSLDVGEDGLKPTTCIACRMRRKKCDRKNPICSSCEELNISAELCICPHGKLGLKSKNSKVTLDTLKKEQKQLLEEKKHLESLLNGDPVTPDVRMKLSQILNNEQQKSKKFERNPFLSLRTKNGHFGPSSWASTLATNPSAAEFMAEINKIMVSAKYEYEKRKGTLDAPPPYPELNELKGKIVSACLGINPINPYELVGELLKQVAKALPPYATSVALLHRYFYFNKLRKIGFIFLDEEEFFESFYNNVGQDPDGNILFQVSLPGEESKLAFTFLFTSMMTIMVFQLNQTFAQATSFDHMKIHYQCEALYHLSMIVTKVRQKQASVVVQYQEFDFKVGIRLIQGLVHYNVFDRYFPHGRLIELEDDTMGHSIAVKRALTLMRGMNVHKTIEIFYPECTKSYKESLQSLLLFLAYLDAGEAFESGVLPKLYPDELLLPINPKREKYRESVLLINITIRELNKHEGDDAMKVVKLITTKLVPNVKKLLAKTFKPMGESMSYMENFDMDDLSNMHRFFEMTEDYSVQLTLLSLIQTLYNFCAKRLEENHRFSPLQKQYSILCLKYGILVFHSIPKFLGSLQRLSTHKNSDAFGTLPAFFGTFPHIRLALRRCLYFIGVRVFDSFPVDKHTLLRSLYEKHEKTDEEILREILSRQNFRHFFTFEDLEDFEIDDDQTRLLDKFSSLNSYTYLILSMGKAFVDLQNCLKTQYVNLSYIRLSPSFFKSMKVCSVFLNNAFTNAEPQPPEAPQQYDQHNSVTIVPSQEQQQNNPSAPPQGPYVKHENTMPMPQQIFSQSPPGLQQIPRQQEQNPASHHPSLDQQQQQQLCLNQQLPQQNPIPLSNSITTEVRHLKVEMSVPPDSRLDTAQAPEFPASYIPLIPVEAAAPPSTSLTATPNTTTDGAPNQFVEMLWVDESNPQPAVDLQLTQSEMIDFDGFFNTPGLYHAGNLEEFLSQMPYSVPNWEHK